MLRWSKKDPTTSIRKHAYELKIHEKTGRTAIKPDLKLKLFARTPQNFLSMKMKEKRLMKCKKHQNFVRKIFLYFGLQIYGLHEAQTITLLITLYGVF